VKFGDKISRNCLRKTQTSQNFIKEGTIRLKNARAYCAGSLPRNSAVMFSTVYFCQFCDIKNLANFSQKIEKLIKIANFFCSNL
jgi:hypothetical protein